MVDIGDLGPMPSMPFAVIYSGEQPGSAVSFAVVSPLAWWKIRILAGLLAVLSLYLTAISATAVRFFTPAAARGHV
jgi:hypothetical protein